ncbi:MAG: hypothetical protein ACJASG_000937, partial [Oleiphilaceae bacterium]
MSAQESWNFVSGWSFSLLVRISELKMAGKTVFATSLQHLQLIPSVKGFSPKFSCLDYSVPRSNQYKYKLEGYDHDWIATNSKSRIATYTNLDPGKHTLRIQGTSRQDA